MVKHYLSRTGICTSDFTTLPAELSFAKAARAGFSSVQLSLSSTAESSYTADGAIEFPDCASDECALLAGAVSSAAEKHGIEVVSVNGTFNMAHPDSEVRLEGVRRYDALLALSRDIGCGIVTLCSGTRYRPHLWRYSAENDTPEAWADMLDTMLRVTEKAERHGITLAVETEAANVISTPEKARKLLDAVGSDKLKMILDPANLFPAGEAKKENVRPILRRAFEVFGCDVVLAHGKDIRESDGISFCPTGEGIVDYAYLAELLDEYGFCGDMMLHGIYDDEKFVSCREFWEKARDSAAKK